MAVHPALFIDVRICYVYKLSNDVISIYSYFGESRLKDVDSKCIGGCVAKSVGEKEEKLHFFNTASIKYMDVPIYKVTKK